MIINMFPGQGSQVRGMGADLFELFPQKCEQASRILGYDLIELCLSDSANQLNQTFYTQPALYVICALSFEQVTYKPDLLLGHSLGLYPALLAAEAFSFEQGLAIVATRARLMAEVNNGSMMAVLGKDIERLDELLLHHSFYDIDIANYNSSSQVVVSGKQNRLHELRVVLEKQDYRVVPLPVSGAFHSRYMKQAAVAFYDFLTTQSFQPLRIPVISTTSGARITETHLIEELAYQLIKPVRWQQVIAYLKTDYPNAAFLEIGPGRVLTSLNLQI